MKKQFLLKSRKTIFFFLLITTITNAYSQYTGAINGTAVGYAISDRFPYQNYSPSNYGLGWYYDNDYTAQPMSYLSGYGGIKFFTAGQCQMNISVNGGVGIGTSYVPGRFSVYQQLALGTSAKNNKLITTIGGSAFGNSFLQNTWLVRNSAGSDWSSARLHDGISVDGSFQNPQIDTRTWWERDPAQDVQGWGTGGSNYLSIVQGKVGIGTVSPTTKLQIGNFAQSDGSKDVCIPGTYNFEQVNLRNGVDGNGELEFVTHQTATLSGGIKFFSSYGANLMLQTASLINGYSSLNYTTRAAFNNDGTIGFNTTTIPSGYLFAVNGNAIINKVTVKTYPWSDYVFDKDHKMLPLGALEKFIKQNHHLPEVPSAAEVEKNGIDIGSNQALLLKKIEELTLIIIDLNKKLERQQESISKLENNSSN